MNEPITIADLDIAFGWVYEKIRAQRRLNKLNPSYVAGCSACEQILFAAKAGLKKKIDGIELQAAMDDAFLEFPVKK